MSLKAPALLLLAHCLAVGHKHLPKPSPGPPGIRACGESYGWEDSRVLTDHTVEFGSAGTSRLGARMVYLSSDQLLSKGPVVGL